MKRLLLSLSIVLLTATSCLAGIDFDGTDDYVNGADSFYSNTLTISAWIFIEAVPTSGSEKPIVHKRNSSGVTAGVNEWDFNIGYGSATNSFLAFFAWSSSAATIINVNTSANPTLLKNTWYHVVARCDGTDADVLIDGIETDGAQTGTIRNAVSLIQIGSMNSSNTNRYFNGLITEVAIWNVYLTDDEIGQLKKHIRGKPLQVRSGNLKIYLPMNDGTVGTSADGDTVADKSGNGQNGTGVDGANNTGLSWTRDSFLRRIVNIL